MLRVQQKIKMCHTNEEMKNASYILLQILLENIKCNLSPSLKKKYQSLLPACQTKTQCFRQAFMTPYPAPVGSSLPFWELLISTCSIFLKKLVCCTCLLILTSLPWHRLPPTHSQYIISMCLSPTYHLKPNNHATSSTEPLPSGNCLPFSWLSTAFHRCVS